MKIERQLRNRLDETKAVLANVEYTNKELVKERDSLQEAYNAAMNELEPLKANHTSLGDLFELAKRDRDRWKQLLEIERESAAVFLKERNAALESAATLRDELHVMRERISKIAGESEGLHMRNKELSAKLLYYVELARRICTLA